MDEEIQREKDRGIRRRMLSMLLKARKSPMGGLSGSTLREMVDNVGYAAGEVCDDEGHALLLVRSLAGKGMVRETFLPRKKSLRFDLSCVFYRILDKGERLLNETEPPDPDIADDRIVSPAD